MNGINFDGKDKHEGNISNVDFSHDSCTFGACVPNFHLSQDGCSIM
jgi:hypothetical protein